MSNTYNPLMKQGMSSFDIAAMVKELQCLVGGRIEKAYQIAREKLLLRIRILKEGRKDLVIIVGKWLYLASQPQETPKSPTSFAMLLRKHLSNGTVTKIEQHGFDRIVVFHFQKEERYQLICELFREGNVVLVQEGKIIQPLIPKSWSRREVRAHREYKFPPFRQDFKTLDLKGFKKILGLSKNDIVRTLALDFNLGGQYAEELCILSGIDKKRKVNELSDSEVQNIFKCMKQLLDSMDKAEGGYMILEEDVPRDITPFELKSNQDYKAEKFHLFSQAVEKYIEIVKEEEPEDLEFEEVKAKYKRQLSQQEEAIANLEKRAQENKGKAELIYVHYKEIEEILNMLKKGIKEKDTAEIISSLGEFPSFKKLEMDKTKVTLSFKDEKDDLKDIALNYKISVEKNAGLYYDKAKKAREKGEGARKSLKETKKRLAKVQVEKEERKKRTKKQTKQFWFEKYKWFISSHGNIVIAGRDAKTNDKVVKKYLTDKDRYAHAEIHGAPSVVIKNKDGEISNQTLKEACEFAFIHSKAWNSKIGSGSAYWVLPNQVSKTPPSGEFLARGAFIIRGKRNHVTDIELKFGVGSIQYEGTEKMMCAPVSAMESRSQRYIIFEPGNMKKSTFVRKLCTIFNVDQKEVERILPPGDVNIIRTVGVPEVEI